MYRKLDIAIFTTILVSLCIDTWMLLFTTQGNASLVTISVIALSLSGQLLYEHRYTMEDVLRDINKDINGKHNK